jgi:hypothetical protein
MSNGSDDGLHTYQFGAEAKIYERVIFDNRKSLLVIFALVTVFLLSQLPNLKMDTNFLKMIPREHNYIQAMEAHLKDLGATGTPIQISVEHVDGDIFDPEYLEVLRKVSDELFYIDGVDRNSLKSLWTPNVRWSAVTEEGFEGDVVITASSKTDMNELKKNVLRSGMVGILVADNFRSSIVQANLVDVDPETGVQLDYARFSRDLEQKIRDEYQNDKIKIHIVGFAKLIGDLTEGGTWIVLFAAIALVITLVLLYIYSRCITGTIAPLACSLIAVLWQLGILAAIGQGINAYSMLVPFLVFAIGVSHGVQIINAITIEMSKGAEAYLAARKAYRALYIAGMTALVSDAIGFLTLLLIEIEAIKDLAMAAGIGVFVIILTNLVLLPIIMSYTGISKNGIAHIQSKEHSPSILWEKLAMFANPKVAKYSILIALVGFGVGFVGSQGLKVGDLDAGAPELHPDSRYNLDVKYMNENYATSSDIMVIMVDTAPEKCSRYDNMEVIDRFAWNMENVPGVQTAVSLPFAAKQVLAGFNEASLKWQTVIRNQRALDSTFFMLPPELKNNSCSFTPIILFLADHKAETLERVVESAEAFIAENNSDEIQFWLATGNAGVEAATNQEIGKAQSRMMWLVYGVVCLLVFASFTSIAAVACIIIPLALTSILCQALMAYLGIGIKVATLPVIALGVGIGVDYGIYIYGRLETYLAEGMPLQEAYYHTLRTTGKAVAFTGITLGIGVGTWIWSPIKFQADMGKLLTFMFLWNMVGALWLLPALAQYLIKPEKLIAKENAKSAKG